MAVRIRVPELLSDEIPTAYALAKASGGRISPSSAARLVRNRGAIGRFDAPVIEALIDVFHIESFDDLFAIEKDSRRKR